MKRGSIRVVWVKLEIKQEVILYLGTYPLPQSDLIFLVKMHFRFVCRNIVRNYKETGFFWEQYDQEDGKGIGTPAFTGWTSLVVLIMAEEYGQL